MPRGLEVDPALTEASEAVSDNDDEGNGKGVLAATERLNKFRQQEGLLDIHLRLNDMRQDYLGQVNTQAAVVAGAAAALLSSGETAILEEETICTNERIPAWMQNVTHCELGLLKYAVPWEMKGNVPVCQLFESLINLIYVFSAVLSFVLAIAVIYSSMNLVNMIKVVMLHGQGERDVRRMGEVVQRAMIDVRKKLVLSLICLLVAVMMMVAEQSPVKYFPWALLIGFAVCAHTMKQDIETKSALAGVLSTPGSQPKPAPPWRTSLAAFTIAALAALFLVAVLAAFLLASLSALTIAALDLALLSYLCRGKIDDGSWIDRLTMDHWLVEYMFETGIQTLAPPTDREKSKKKQTYYRLRDEDKAPGLDHEPTDADLLRVIPDQGSSRKAQTGEAARTARRLYVMGGEAPSLLPGLLSSQEAGQGKRLGRMLSGGLGRSPRAS